ncbi:MAG: hypothetical protein R2827_01640 [Bdellovibrionales bacterium]
MTRATWSQFKKIANLAGILILQLIFGALPVVQNSAISAESDIPEFVTDGLGQDVLAQTQQTYRVIEKKEQSSRFTGFVDGVVESRGSNSLIGQILSPFLAANLLKVAHSALAVATY